MQCIPTFEAARCRLQPLRVWFRLPPMAAHSGKFALLAVLVALPVAAQQSNSIAFERARQLRHGINTSMWFAQAGDYSVQRLQTFTTPDDLALIANMGFDHIRLSIDAEPLLQWQRAGAETGFMTELDRVVKTAIADRLSVIIDLHPESSYKATLRVGSREVQDFVVLWRALASRFASTPPERLFFEIMNEPEQDDSYRWQGIQAVVVQAIREVAPSHTIIAAGAHWSGLEDLLALELLADPNVIYTFHDYEPFAFTHQGATWTSIQVRPLRTVPYPSTPDDVAASQKQEPDLSGEFFVARYGMDRWDADRVRRTVDFARRWSDLHHAPVYCGEFGVFRNYAPPVMRAQWLHDMRVALEKDRIGWAMWDYQASFGVVSKINGTTTPDAQVLEALGLHMPGK